MASTAIARCSSSRSSGGSARGAALPWGRCMRPMPGPRPRVKSRKRASRRVANSTAIPNCHATSSLSRRKSPNQREPPRDAQGVAAPRGGVGGPAGAAMPTTEVKVPDIGDFKEVAVIEVLVKPGDTVKVEQSLVTVESDKASMEIPSSQAGVVKEMKVKVGDKVSEGSVLLVVEAAAASGAVSPPPPGEGRVGAPPAPARRAGSGAPP